MAKWYRYKGFKIGQSAENDKYFILNHEDINDPLKTGLDSIDSCKNYIDSIEV